MSSYSTPLPPCFTPGWNDPPTNLNGERKPNGSRLMTHKHRRPVDPCIQGSHVPAVNSSPSHLQVFNGYGHASNSAPELQALVSNNVMNYPVEAQNGHSTADMYKQNSQSQLTHRAVYDAFTVPSASYQKPYDFAQIRPTFYVNGTVPNTGIPLQQNFTNGDLNAAPVVSNQLPAHTAAVNYVPSAPGPPIESNPSALIYTPPNVVGEHQPRPTTSPNPASYIAPMKAPGDVSLNGAQLVHFLTKATLRLTPGVTRDGIQLRIGQFHELINANGVSDGCIKRLNFVVDALDRGLYDEALQFFEQMQSAFGSETKTSWAQGVRLLIQELKRPARSGSAGTMNYR